jgi:hypothetical protein
MVFVGFKGEEFGLKSSMQVPAGGQGEGLFVPFFVKMLEFRKIRQQKAGHIMHIAGAGEVFGG